MPPEGCRYTDLALGHVDLLAKIFLTPSSFNPEPPYQESIHCSSPLLFPFSTIPRLKIKPGNVENDTRCGVLCLFDFWNGPSFLISLVYLCVGGPTSVFYYFSLALRFVLEKRSRGECSISCCECFTSGMSIAGGTNGLLKTVASSGIEILCLRMFFWFLASSYSIRIADYRLFSRFL